MGSIIFFLCGLWPSYIFSASAAASSAADAAAATVTAVNEIHYTRPLYICICTLWCDFSLTLFVIAVLLCFLFHSAIAKTRK